MGQLLGMVKARLTDELHRRLDAAGYTDIRPVHGPVFHHLTPEGLRLSQLAELSRMTKQAMAEHVLELEGLGYLIRVPDAADGRAKLIQPTDKSLAAMAVARDALHDIEVDWGMALGERRVAQMRDTLEAIRAMYDR
jgi:DNA-binding MarR family transcriptional regulator